MNKVSWGILLAVFLLWGTAFGNDDFTAPGSGEEKAWSNGGAKTQHLSALTGVDAMYVDEGEQIEAEFLDDDLDFLDEEEGGEVMSVPDPLAPWNRVMFRFNDRFYYWFVKPVSTGYKHVVPTPVRHSVSNFFTNITAPVRAGSCLVQGRAKEAQVEFARFAVNTTFGVGGLWDPASQSPELEPSSEDMGQALGAHGVKEGFYVVWPVLGPSTMRDTAGTVGDMFMNPISYLPLAASLGLSGQKNLNAASFRGEDYEDLTEAAIDPYDAVRDAYLQYRRAEIEK